MVGGGWVGQGLMGPKTSEYVLGKEMGKGIDYMTHFFFLMHKTATSQASSRKGINLSFIKIWN